MTSPIVYGMGNPLLDISANVPESHLEKYQVKGGNACLAEEHHMPVYEDLINNFDVDYIAGGATQNSIRVCQWMLQKEGATAYVGCIGKDAYGEQLVKAAAGDGVHTHYCIDEKTPTGTCAVLVVGKERSLIANLAAANCYKHEHLQQEDTQSLVKSAQFFYIASFFLTVSPESAMDVAKHCAENNKTFCMNLSAPFLLQVPIFRDRMFELMPYMDILFGNEDEARTLAEAKEWTDANGDVAEIARRASELPKVNAARPRLVVFTQGASATCVAVSGKVQTFVPKKLDADKIIDTNGAGDAFVGGFLSQLAEGHGDNIHRCVEAGHYAAQVIIQQSGCKCPGKPDFVFEA